MFSQKALKQIHRRKQTVVARGDLLRKECGEMWSAMGRRAEVVENCVSGLRWVRPAVTVVSLVGSVYLRRRHLSAAGVLGSLANFAADVTRKPSGAAESPPLAPTLPEGPEN